MPPLPTGEPYIGEYHIYACPAAPRSYKLICSARAWAATPCSGTRALTPTAENRLITALVQCLKNRGTLITRHPVNPRGSGGRPGIQCRGGLKPALQHAHFRENDGLGFLTL